MDDFYRQTTEKMEQANINPDYIMGWQSGYLGHPDREEQRASEAYQAGLADGKEKNTDNFSSWANK